MKHAFWLKYLILFVYLCGSQSLLAETSHYVNGVEGIKASTLPPPGLYVRQYHVYYSADEIKDRNGDDAKLGVGIDVYALVHRVLWMSETKVLGGNLGASAVIPLIYSDIDLDALGLSGNEFGIGDIALEPVVLSWHGERYDAAFGLAAYVPTGKFSAANPASPGKDMWTGMVTLGGTVYLDSARTWSASILNRYEFHSRKDEVRIKPGNDFHFEWGIGKTVAQFWDVGLSGYAAWQITNDSGPDVNYDRKVRDRVASIGPEIIRFFPEIGLFVRVATQWEFEAVDRSEGNITSLTLTKAF